VQLQRIFIIIASCDSETQLGELFSPRSLTLPRWVILVPRVVTDRDADFSTLWNLSYRS